MRCACFPTPRDVPDVSLELAGYGLAAAEFLSPSVLVNPSSVMSAARSAAGNADTLLDTVWNVVRWGSGKSSLPERRHRRQHHKQHRRVLDSMVGVCQDKTHLALGMLRGPWASRAGTSAAC